MKKQRRHYTPEEKVAILRRHLHSTSSRERHVIARAGCTGSATIADPQLPGPGHPTHKLDFSLQTTLRPSLLGSYLRPAFVTEGRSLTVWWNFSSRTIAVWLPAAGVHWGPLYP